MELELTKTNLSIELKKADLTVKVGNYQKALQDAEKITFSKDTIKQDYEPLKLLRDLKNKVEAIENQYTKDWQEWNDARNSILNPIKEVLKRKTDEYKTLADEIKAEQDKATKENERINDIKDKIVRKKIWFAQTIAVATNLNDLVAVERLIGLEKTRTEYMEYLPELVFSLDELVPLIKKQKGRFKELKAVSSEMESVTDDRTMMNHLEKQEDLHVAIERTQKEVQHIAINSGMNVQEVETEPTTEVPDGRRKVWKWKVTNIDLLKKAFPLLVQTIPNKEALDQLLRDAKKNKTIKASNSNGLEIYQETLY